MDDILFNRLLSTVVAELGPNFTADLAKLAVTIMTFIENKIEQELMSNEKLALFETWLKKLVNSTQGAPLGLGGLEASTVALIKSFVGQICKASKGQLSLNNGSAKVQSLLATGATRASAQAVLAGQATSVGATTKDTDSNSLNGTKKKSLFRRS